MVYKKRVSFRKPLIKKKAYKGRRPAKKSTRRSLVNLIKKVSLKQSETKNTLAITQNQQLYHNVPFVVPNLLYCTQGITDNQTGTSFYANRVGDQVIGRGVSIKLWIANKLDRPNVMYRIFIIKHQSSLNMTASSPIFKSQSGNLMMDDIDNETYKIVYHKRVNIQVGFSSAVEPSTWKPREAHKMVSIWLPLKNKKIQYDDTGDRPKFINYSMVILPYDSYGTLTTDNISSYAMNLKFYFKDP